MVLLIFAVIGLLVGYRLGMTRAGYITLALTTFGFSVGQIVLLFATRSRDAMTMLPLVLGATLVLSMFLGALLRLAIRDKAKAA